MNISVHLLLKFVTLKVQMFKIVYLPNIPKTGTRNFPETLLHQKFYKPFSNIYC